VYLSKLNAVRMPFGSQEFCTHKVSLQCVHECVMSIGKKLSISFNNQEIRIYTCPKPYQEFPVLAAIRRAVLSSQSCIFNIL
jgi:hypothetical protein